MKINKKQIEQLKAYNDKIDSLKEIVSEQLKTAQDRHGGEMQVINRNGVDVQVSEKILWDEVFYLGTNSDAGKVLEKVHPEIFQNYRDQTKVSAEMSAFCIEQLGFDFKAMTISNYIALTTSLIEMVLDEKTK